MVLSDRIVVRITSEPGQSFVDRMIALVEGSERQRTPNEIALNVLLASLTAIFVVVVATLWFFADYSGARQSLIVLTALLVCLIPTTIGALLSAIGIAGMDRLVRRNVLAMSGRAVEAAGDVDVLLLDKTGTVTFGNRQATELLPLTGDHPRGDGRGVPARLARRRDPRGPQHRRPGRRSESRRSRTTPTLVEFSRHDPDERHRPRASGSIRKGAGSAVAKWVHSSGTPAASEAFDRARRVWSSGSARPAAPRWSSPRGRAPTRRGCSASSTSRTSSRRACASGSTRCARWASGP